jgi:hypothetical protein
LAAARQHLPRVQSSWRSRRRSALLLPALFPALHTHRSRKHTSGVSTFTLFSPPQTAAGPVCPGGQRLLRRPGALPRQQLRAVQPRHHQGPHGRLPRRRRRLHGRGSAGPDKRGLLPQPRLLAAQAGAVRGGDPGLHAGDRAEPGALPRVLQPCVQQVRPAGVCGALKGGGRMLELATPRQCRNEFVAQ